MRDLDIYERRAREAEELAKLVSLPQNRVRYLAIAQAWRQMLNDVRQSAPDSTRAA